MVSLGDLGREFQSALRELVRRPSLVILAMACLAPAAGTSGAMLAVLDGLLYRPPSQVSDTGSLRRLYLKQSDPGYGGTVLSELPFPVYRDLKLARSFSGLGLYLPVQASLGRGEAAHDVRAEVVSPGLLPLLGVRPILGRVFLTSAGEPEGEVSSVVVGHDVWQRDLEGRADALGRRLLIAGRTYEVVGVMPKGFQGLEVGGADLWLPLSAAERWLGPQWPSSLGTFAFEVVGRLRGGVRPEIVGSEATAVLRGLRDPNLAQTRVVVGPIQRSRGPEAPAEARIVAWMTGLSSLVLLVACANVGNLLLLRCLDRQKDLVVRLALGARRHHLVRLLLLEASLLGLVAGGVALVVMRGEISLLQRLLVESAAAFRAEGRSLVGLGLVLVVATILSGAIPWIWASGLDDFKTLRAGGATGSRHLLLRGVIAAQIALTYVLLVVGGEFAFSLRAVLHQDFGMDIDRVAVVSADLAREGYNPDRERAIFREAGKRIRRLAGVEATGLAALVPFESGMVQRLKVPGLAELPRSSMGGPYINAVSEDFFTTLGTAVRKGRAFTAWDRTSAARVAVVNQAMAHLLWPGRSALGECLQVGGAGAPCSTVVGIVNNARQFGFDEQPAMQYFVPLGQAQKSLPGTILFVRFREAAAPSLEQLRREVQAVEPGLPFIRVRRLEDLLASQIQPWREGTRILALFGSLALTLSVAGLYGLLSNRIRAHLPELGIRIALGAGRRALVRLIVQEAVGVGLAGALLGLVLAVIVAHSMEAVLFQEVAAWNPWLLLAVTIFLAILVLMATLFSGLQVLQMDPAAVLRKE